jgi:hypothetical protein
VGPTGLEKSIAKKKEKENDNDELKQIVFFFPT